MTTPDLYQCQYEKATKCAMDLPCLGCETHAKYAKVTKESDPIIHELNITVKSFEWRREIDMNPIRGFPPEHGRILIKAYIDSEPNITVQDAYAVSVNEIWYMPSIHDNLDQLWKELEK